MNVSTPRWRMKHAGGGCGWSWSSRPSDSAASISQTWCWPDSNDGRGGSMKLRELAVAIGGELVGDGEVVVTSVTEVGRAVPGALVMVGAGAVIYPRVAVYDRTEIGRRVILHSGAVVGSDGFGYAVSAGEHVKIPHIGRVVIEDDVEIGANTTIDRATLGETRIGAGTKIDNLVQVAHNVP